MAHLGILVTLLGALALILRECGVFESIRQRNLERSKPKQRRREREKVYDHDWPEDES